MRATPSIAAGLTDDVDVYLVLDDFGGRLGRPWREAAGGPDESRIVRPIAKFCAAAHPNP